MVLQAAYRAKPDEAAEVEEARMALVSCSALLDGDLGDHTRPGRLKKR
jgi:hypothetical protein